MYMVLIQAYLNPLLQYLPFIIITSIVWLVYGYTLKLGACSDDIPGIMEFDGKLQGFEYGMLWRWIRFQICGGLTRSKHKNPDGTPVPNGKVASHHHFLSVLVFDICRSFLEIHYC